jgi:ribosomal protein S27AE
VKEVRKEFKESDEKVCPRCGSGDLDINHAPDKVHCNSCELNFEFREVAIWKEYNPQEKAAILLLTIQLEGLQQAVSGIIRAYHNAQSESNINIDDIIPLTIENELYGIGRIIPMDCEEWVLQIGATIERLRKQIGVGKATVSVQK